MYGTSTERGGEKSMKLDNESFENEIRAKAHEIYERNGRVDGRDLDNWIEAKQIVFARCAEKVSRRTKVKRLAEGHSRVRNAERGSDVTRENI
jgi:hypothetical protein